MNIKNVLLFLCFPMFYVHAGAQVIDTISREMADTIDNYTVSDFDTYFTKNTQLIAYGSSSGNSTGDTLFILDYLHDTVICKLIGTRANYKISFIDNNRLIFFNDGYTIYSVNNFTSPEVKEILTENYPVIPYDVVLSPDKSKIAVRVVLANNNKNKVILYNYITAEDTTAAVDTFDIPEVNHESGMAISDSNHLIALSMGYERDSVLLIHVATHETDTIATSQNAGTYSPVFFHNNGKLYLAVGGGYDDGSVDIIDVAAKTLVDTVPVFLNYNYSVAVDSTQGYMLCGGYNGELRVMDIHNLQFNTIASDFPSHVIFKAAFTKDNQYIVAGTGASKAELIVYKILYKQNQTETGLRQTKNDISIYPVPVENVLYIGGSNVSRYVQIYTITGILVLKQSVPNGIINLSGLPAGTYLLRIIDGKFSTVVRKIVKQ